MPWILPVGLKRPGREEEPDWSRTGPNKENRCKGKNVEETILLLFFMYAEDIRKCKDSAYRNNAERQI